MTIFGLPPPNILASLKLMIYKALIHADPGPTTLKTFLAAKDYFNIEDRWIKRLNETMKKPSRTGVVVGMGGVVGICASHIPIESRQKQ